MKATEESPILTVPKEDVLGFEFPTDEVLNSEEQIAQRRRDLERSLSLGNLDHVKVRIVFSDKECMKQVETTVWGLTDKRVILKGGAVIPINRVHRVI